MIKPHLEEKILIQNICIGCEKSFSTLYNWYYQPLYKIVLKTTKSKIYTEEILQDIFTQLWKDKETLHEINNLTGYIFILARNKSLNCVRKKVYKYVELVDVENQFTTSQQQQHINYTAYIQLYEEAISLLPEIQKNVYVLNKIDEKKLADIALQLNLSIDSTKKLSSKATEFIKSYFTQHLAKSIYLLLFFLK